MANPITFIDILKTPSYERVWQISRVGELAGAKCKEFEREEWAVRRLKEKRLK